MSDFAYALVGCFPCASQVNFSGNKGAAKFDVTY